MIFERDYRKNPEKKVWVFETSPIISEKGEVEFKKSWAGVFELKKDAIEYIRSRRRKISIPRWFRGYKPCDVRKRFFEPHSPWGNPKDFLGKHPEVSSFLTTYEIR